MDELRAILLSCGQEHIIDMIPTLDEDHPIFSQLKKLDIPSSLRICQEARAAAISEQKSESLAPLEDVLVWCQAESSLKDHMTSVGLNAIKEGEVAAVIMSGGQGTRLGFSGPKGMYKMGLQSGKSIFQLHIEKIQKMKALSGAASVPIYIMTSDLNDSIIRKYFKDKHYFGYPSEDIIFFEQGLQPCISLDGKIIVECETSLALAPDGNGGMYNALRHSGAFEDMCERRVKYLHIYGIDNVLTKSIDPSFLGYCIDKCAECGNKVVWRANKSEKVGVTASANGRMRIVEYSELPAQLADSTDADGKLVYGAGNICNHFLTLEFVRDKVFPNLSANYHVAMKKIPHWDISTNATVKPETVNGVKLEMFIFDVFPLAENWCVMEVDREDEFAPVKNEPGNPVDSPDTARAMISAQAIRWLEAAGASVATSKKRVLVESDDSVLHSAEEPHYQAPLCEISPLLTYGGEGLEAYRGVTVSLPSYLS